MKLRLIRLQNVRRFIDPVEITGIGDGLNVLSAPNEYGKSTVFDALHALFFKDHKARDAKIKALVPHAGGDPAVAVEIDLADGRYRVEKLWRLRGKRGEVRITKDGRLVRQSEEAEAWIAEVLKAPKDGGPAGLLWVRQGQSGLDADKNAGLARRDLMSSVAGEVDAMTGGRRMDVASDRCRQELDRYLTRQGRAKKGGDLKRAQEHVDQLTGRREDLQAKSRFLRSALDRRRTLRRELNDLSDPEEDAERRERLTAAEAAKKSADRHQEVLDKAQAAERAHRSERDRAQERLTSLEKEVSEEAEAKEAHQQAQAATALAARRRVAAREEREAASQESKRAASRAEFAQDILSRVLRRAAAGRRLDLLEQLEQAEEWRQRLDQAEADAKAEIDRQVIDELETLHTDMRVLRRARDNEAVAITMDYMAGRAGGVTLEGAPLPGGDRTAIPDGARLEIAGMGRLTIHPGRKAGDESWEAAEATLAQALASAHLHDIDDGRASALRRKDAVGRARDAQAALKAVAPYGIQTLRDRIAATPDHTDEASDLPTQDEAQKEAYNAKKPLHGADIAHEKARAASGRAEQEAARAAAELESAAARVDRAEAALLGMEDPKTELTLRWEALSRRREDLAESERRRIEIAAAVPDLIAVKSALERARSTLERAEKDLQRMRLELGKLDTSIELQAGEAVEEELAHVVSRLEKAERHLKDIEFEVEVLQELKSALEDARKSSRDLYVAPVLREIKPLLDLLLPDAEIRFDADKVLPSALVRAGAEEGFDILSGGTREQIALLVRLAFARMLHNAGAPAPVILDDAIVYTDDFRIEQLFDALTRLGKDLQIIVFSCRQKAFRGLGGCSLAFAQAGP